MQITAEQVLVTVGLALAAWYLMAMIYNRRRGHAAYRWLVSGLHLFGEGHESKWLGSAASGAQIVVSKAAHPFRRVDVIYLLESRELLPLWLFDLLRNKRDQLIFKAVLRVKRQAEVEIAPAGSRTAGRIRKRIDDSWTTAESGAFLIARRGKDAQAVLESLDPFLASYGDKVRSVSWSKGKPEVIIILALGPLVSTGQDAASLYTALRETVERVNRLTDGQ